MWGDEGVWGEEGIGHSIAEKFNGAHCTPREESRWLTDLVVGVGNA